MRPNLLRVHPLLLSLSLLFCVAVPTSVATAQEQECVDEAEMMFEAVEVAAYEIGIEADELFEALAHGLSCAQVAIAHQSRPEELIAALASYEEGLILDLLLDQEIDREEARSWRDENWVNTTWFIHEEDPFGLNDAMWVLDAVCAVTDLDLLELLEWLDDGNSIATLTEETGTELEDVGEMALDLLAMEIDQLVILEQIDEGDAAEWLDWMNEELDSMLADSDFLGTLADEIWLEESVEYLAELLQLEEDDLWLALQDGEEIGQLIEDAEISLEEVQSEFGAEELEELRNLLNGEDEDFDDDEAERHDF